MSRTAPSKSRRSITPARGPRPAWPPTKKTTAKAPATKPATPAKKAPADGRAKRRQAGGARRPPPADARPSDIPAPARARTKDGIAYTKDFDVKFLKAQHDELIAERGRSLGQATRLEDEANSLIEDGEMGDVQFDDESGEGDTMVVERERDLALSAQARQTIADIDAALERIATAPTATPRCPGCRSRASGSRRSRGRRCSSRRRSAASAVAEPRDGPRS